MVAEIPEPQPQSDVPVQPAARKRVLGMPRSWLMALCGAVGISVAAVIIVPAVTGKPAVDQPTTRACHLLAQAQDAMNVPEYLWVQAGRPASGGGQTFLNGIKQYPSSVAQAAHEALAAPADVSASFADAASSARDYTAAINQGNSRDAGVFAWSIGHTVDLCRAKGVEMLIHDPVTGKVTTS